MYAEEDQIMAEHTPPDNSRQNPGSSLRDYAGTCH